MPGQAANTKTQPVASPMVPSVIAFTLGSIHPAAMQLNYFLAFVTWVTFHALAAPIDMMAASTHSNHVHASSTSSVSSTTLSIASFQPSLTETTFTTNVTPAVEEVTGSPGTNTTPTATPAQPSFVSGNNSGPTHFAAANMAIAATGLPIAGVMLYLAWITFVSAHKTQEEHSDPGDDSGEQDTTGSGGGVNEDVELVEYAHITSYARSDDEADFTHRLDAQELHHDE
jgi:hypothetical protein